jgi:hypothetical protein
MMKKVSVDVLQIPSCATHVNSIFTDHCHAAAMRRVVERVAFIPRQRQRLCPRGPSRRNHSRATSARTARTCDLARYSGSSGISSPVNGTYLPPDLSARSNSAATLIFTYASNSRSAACRTLS